VCNPWPKLSPVLYRDASALDLDLFPGEASRVHD
jgi:hypothetical protein